MSEKNTEKTNGKKPLLGPVALDFNSVRTGNWRIVRPLVDQAACIRCHLCREFCPTDVITVRDKDEPGDEPGDAVSFDWDYCKGCGICANVCSKQCIEMVDEKKAVGKKEKCLN